jgi:hypothetical protein
MTNEGPKAVQEAIDFLKQQEPIDALEYCFGLTFA